MAYLMLRSARRARLEARTDIDAAFFFPFSAEPSSAGGHDRPMQTYGKKPGYADRRVGVGEGRLRDDGCSGCRSHRARWRISSRRAGLGGAFRQPFPFAGIAAAVPVSEGGVGCRV